MRLWIEESDFLTAVSMFWHQEVSEKAQTVVFLSQQGAEISQSLLAFECSILNLIGCSDWLPVFRCVKGSADPVEPVACWCLAHWNIQPCCFYASHLWQVWMLHTANWNMSSFRSWVPPFILKETSSNCRLTSVCDVHIVHALVLVQSASLSCYCCSC